MSYPILYSKSNSRRVIGMAVAGLMTLAWTASAWSASPPVLLGGTCTMTDMLTAANTDAFRAAGGGVYAHQNGWVSNLVYPGDAANSTRSQNNRKAIVDLFKIGSATTVTGHAEFGFGESVNNYNAYYKNNGLIAEVASINGLSGADLGTTNSSYPTDNADAFAYIDTLKAGGISTVNIILAPNNNGSDATNFKFDNAKWDTARARAKYGGGWTSDAPPGYFFNERDQNYRDWVIAETKWTNANGLKSVNIISPRTSGSQFFSQSVQYVRYFEAQDAIPQQWVVENYTTIGDPPPGYVNRIGSEDNSDNLAYTAKWLIGHVQGRAGTLDLWSSNPTGSSTGTTGRSAFSTTPSANKTTLFSDNLLHSYTLNVENLSTNAINDFYAPELSATVTGDTTHWAYKFLFNNVDVTAAVLAGGFTLDGANILDAGETGAFTVTLQRLTGATGTFNLSVYARANPNATIVADTMSFVGTTAAPEPAALGILAVAGTGLLRRRRAHSKAV